jgi:hypothetical protein
MVWLQRPYYNYDNDDDLFSKRIHDNDLHEQRLVRKVQGRRACLSHTCNGKTFNLEGSPNNNASKLMNELVCDGHSGAIFAI